MFPNSLGHLPRDVFGVVPVLPLGIVKLRLLTRKVLTIVDYSDSDGPAVALPTGVPVGDALEFVTAVGVAGGIPISEPPEGGLLSRGDHRLVHSVTIEAKLNLSYTA